LGTVVTPESSVAGTLVPLVPEVVGSVGLSPVVAEAAVVEPPLAVIVSPLIVTPFAVVDVVRLPSSPQATHVRARAQSGAVHFMRAR
jgi:hypothetical protein